MKMVKNQYICVSLKWSVLMYANINYSAADSDQIFPSLSHHSVSITYAVALRTSLRRYLMNQQK